MHRPHLAFLLCFLAVACGAANSVLSATYLPDVIGTLAPSADAAARGTIGAWINFAFLIGNAVGGIAMGFASDRIGRRTVLLLSVLAIGAGAGVGAMAPTWELLAVTRPLVGAGVGSALVVTAVLIAELWRPGTRAVALGVLSVAYPVGIIAAGMITGSVVDWRMGLGLGASALVLLVPVRLFVPETMPDAPSAAAASAPVLTAHQRELVAGILVYGTMLLGLWATFAWLPTWVQSVMGDDPRVQMLRGRSVALLGVGGLVGGLASGWIGVRAGIARVQGVCFVLSFALSLVLFRMSTGFGALEHGLVATLGLVFGVSQGVLNTYVPDLFPAAVRAGATALCFHVGRIFTAAAVFFVGALVEWFGGYGRSIFAFSFCYLIGLAGLWMSRPTRA